MEKKWFYKAVESGTVSDRTIILGESEDFKKPSQIGNREADSADSGDTMQGKKETAMLKYARQLKAFVSTLPDDAVLKISYPFEKNN